MKINEILIVKNKKFLFILTENDNNFIDAQYYYFFRMSHETIGNF